MIKRINRRILVMLLLVLAVGVALMWWVAYSTDKRMRAELLEQARIAAQAINIERVAALSGLEQDLNTPGYQRIKSQLSLMRNARHQCRFLYLMGQRSDGVVFFFVDSLPADSEDYAPPGLVYEEVSDSYLRAFDTKQETVVGPITDRWGTLVTALIPLRAPHTGNLVAVLGMDVDAKDWHKEILGRCSIPFAAMLLFAVLILLMASREQAVKARRASEEKHRLFFENSPIGIIHYDNQGIITDVNEAMITTFGSSREKLIGLDIDDIQDKRFANEVYKSLDGELGYYEGEYTSYTGGKTSIIKANWIPIFRNGNVVAGVGIVEDITERKQALERTERLNRLNEELLGSGSLNEKLRLITDEIVKIFKADFARIWMIKPGDLCDSECFHTKVTEGPHVCRYRERCLHLLASSGRYTHIDGGHRRVPFGSYKIGRVATEDEPKFLTNDVINDPRIHDHEWARKLGLVSFVGYRLLSADGRVIGVLALFSKKAISSEEDAQLESLAGTTAQIIQTTTAEEALRASEEKFRFLTENIADIVWVLDRDFCTNYVSPSIENVLGFTPEERKRQSLEEMITPESLQRVQTKFLEELQHDENGVLDSDRSVTIEVEYCHKDGSTVWMENIVNAIRGPSGAIVGMYGVSRDITERKKAEEALRESEKKYRNLFEESKRAEEVYRSLIHSSADAIIIYDHCCPVNYSMIST